MARIYGQIDSLTRLLSILKGNGVTFLTSLHDIQSFKQEYESTYREIEKEVEEELALEINTVKEDIRVLKNHYNSKLCENEQLLSKERDSILDKIESLSEINTNLFIRFCTFFKIALLKKRRNVIINNFEREIKKPFIPLEKELRVKCNRLDYLDSNRSSIILDQVNLKSKIMRKAKNVLDENYNILLGAIGEQKVVDELKKLPDSFTVINNFALEFSPPILNKKTGESIVSIQTDHIVIGPSGVFLIETKNWSQNSINNENFYSPVDQIRRSNYALFRYLNNSVNQGFLSLFTNHWGEQRVSIHSIILMIGKKPQKEYQFVKILNVSELCSYIKYFKPIYNDEEVQNIVGYLM